MPPPSSFAIFKNHSFNHLSMSKCPSVYQVLWMGRILGRIGNDLCFSKGTEAFSRSLQPLKSKGRPRGKVLRATPAQFESLKLLIALYLVSKIPHNLPFLSTFSANTAASVLHPGWAGFLCKYWLSHRLCSSHCG